MRRLNLTTSLTIAGDATTGSIAYSGLTSPTVTEVGDNPDVSVGTDGSFTLADALADGSEVVTVKVQDAAGYFIQGPVTITGNGAGIEYAELGMNLASPTTYAGAYQFANVCLSMGSWDRFSGSGGFTQNFGELTPNVPTDIFRAYLSDAGVGWIDGVYHVENPDGCEIALGSFGNPTAYKNWTTATSFDVTLNAGGGNLIGLFCRGGLTNINGPLKIMMPGHSVSDIWSNDFIAYHQGMPAQPIRFMDFVSASDNIETEWSHRTSVNSISFRSPNGYGKPVVPWEHIIDLCNRLDRDAWVNVPVRAGTTYMTLLAALLASGLNPGLKVYPERGNETWNPGTAWFEGFQWTQYIASTRYTATANYGANTFTYVGHGMTTGNSVRCFTTPENQKSRYNQPYPYPGVVSGLTNSALAYVEVIDADTFKLYSDAGRTTLLTVAATQISQVFLKTTSTSAASAYGAMLIEMWDIFDAALGASRVVHLIPSQAGGVGVTSARFSNATASARAEYVAVAPYFNGDFWGARITTSSGTFAPQVWSNFDCSGFAVAVYAAGTAPATVDEVMLGTGAITRQIGTGYDHIDYWRGGSAGLSAITGLTNGVSYDVVFVFGNRVMSKATVTASASTTITYFFDNAENQAARMIVDAYNTAPGGHSAAAGGKPVICYELGADFNGDWPKLDDGSTDYHIDDWRKVIQETAVYADAIRKAMYIRAAQGLKVLTYFSDTGTGPFSLANDYTDTSGERYLAMASIEGRVRVYTPPVVADATATRVTSDPGTFPHTIYTFPDASLNYTIVGGNTSGNFDVSGNTIRMIDDKGIDWASSSAYSLSILADNDYVVDTATVSVSVGATVFEAETDALIARMVPAPDTDHKADIDTLIAALKSASVWSKLDGFYVNCAPFGSQITENWVSSKYDQANEGGTFTANSGVAGNGSSAYLNTAFNPATATSPNFQRNSAHLWAFSLTTAASAAGYEVGSDGASGWALSTGRSDQANAPRGGLNDSWANYPVQADCKGMYVISRTSSNLTTMYKNGASIGTSAAASTGAPASYDMAALRYNAIYSDKKLAGWGFGGGLTSGDVSAMSAAVIAYLTARGAI